MATINLIPLKFFKNEMKNETVCFSALQHPYTLHLISGPALSYHFPNAICQT